MALPVEFEILIPIVIAVFFSILYEVDPAENLWSAMIAMVCWLVSGMTFLMISTYPVISLVFMGAFIIYVVRIVMQLYKPLTQSSKRRLEDDTD